MHEAVAQSIEQLSNAPALRIVDRQSISLEVLLRQRQPVLALAPMQDVTDLPFWRLLAKYGGPDLYFTEYFRVYPGSRLNRWILESITENPARRPIIAQLIGHDVPALVRSAVELQAHPVAGIDLNLGCPAPVVYRKCAGGGLLRQPKHIDAILSALREAVQIPLSVKTRIGFDSGDGFDQLLELLGRHRLDLVTVHGRTVKDMYRSAVRYEAIARAVKSLPCPVLANGNVYSALNAASILTTTGARGLMIGRGAIRNPWIFDQIRQHLSGVPIRKPTGRQVLAYVQELYDQSTPPSARDGARVQRMKKYLNYLGLGIEPSGRFLHEIRRAATTHEFFQICSDHLDHDCPMDLEPFPLELGPRDVLTGIHT